MGHAGYLTDAYRRYGVDEVAKWYMENQQMLLVFTNASELQNSSWMLTSVLTINIS